MIFGGPLSDAQQHRDIVATIDNVSATDSKGLISMLLFKLFSAVEKQEQQMALSYEQKTLSILLVI